MIRTLLMLVALALAGMFGYFYFTGDAGRSAGEKLADAARQTGDAAADQGMAAVVKARISVAVGVSLARYLHVWYDDGKALIYGLYPEGMNPDVLSKAARDAGAKEVDIRVAPRPMYLDGSTPAPAPPPGHG